MEGKIPQLNTASLTWKIVQTLAKNLHETKIVTVFLKRIKSLMSLRVTYFGLKSFF